MPDNKTLLSVIELPGHPNFSDLYQKLNIREQRVNSPRKAIKMLKKSVPDLIFAEFLYGYSNNYAGINICNLDVLMYSLPKYAPNAKVIIFVDKSELQYARQFGEMFTLQEILVRPFTVQQLEAVLTPLI
ncbi:hypothetical protein [Candidatus Venteria ishoeyi]|uniref:Response regulatory domain-containing protein n=1 Tax=Candidatus Venteria ishoeyi TaxID=1899563 RepID=A0A1H6F5X6_9GAMM|nr:hypothetical protein [Candidatus Venteria ishoeyi]SEH04791.1 Uncharacterised protein [Candidatus Venteria ishoeyi]